MIKENIKNLIIDSIQNQLIPPLSADGSQGRKALVMGRRAMIRFKHQNDPEALYQIITALKNGVPEPINQQMLGILSEISGITINSLYEIGSTLIITNIETGNKSKTQKKICCHCGSENQDRDNFCRVCGQKL